MKTKKLLSLSLIVLIGMLLSSCGDALPSGNIHTVDPYIVKSIDEWTEVNCQYNLSTGAEYVYLIDNITIVDSIGKFQIGDTILVDFKTP